MLEGVRVGRAEKHSSQHELPTGLMSVATRHMPVHMSVSSVPLCTQIGLCEPCWDCLMLPGMSAQKQLRQCSLLTADGLAVAKHVISACMGMEAVGIEQESDFRHAVSVALGQRPLTCPRR